MLDKAPRRGVHSIHFFSPCFSPCLSFPPLLLLLLSSPFLLHCVIQSLIPLLSFQYTCLHQVILKKIKHCKHIKDSVPPRTVA